MRQPMKIAVVYNRVSRKVINLFGVPNHEKYGLKSIRRIVNCLKQGGHHVISFEGDKDLIDNLEDFMPKVLKGERPGMVFNLSYGIQGQAHYTHVPGILEMVGIPYVGSGPFLLEKYGYKIDLRDPYSFYLGCVQLVVLKNNEFIGVADPRRDGSAGGPKK